MTARLDAEERKFRIETDNITRLALDLVELAEEKLSAPEPVLVEIDGQSLEVAWPEDLAIRLVRSPRKKAEGTEEAAGAASEANATWEVDHAGASASVRAARKGPHRAGPFKDAFRHRMAFVYTTGGNEDENRRSFEKAKFDAETFHYRGNGTIELVADRDLDPTADVDRSIVIYGNADTCRVWDALLGSSPIRPARDRVRIGEREVRGVQGIQKGARLVASEAKPPAASTQS